MIPFFFCSSFRYFCKIGEKETGVGNLDLLSVRKQCHTCQSLSFSLLEISAEDEHQVPFFFLFKEWRIQNCMFRFHFPILVFNLLFIFHFKKKKKNFNYFSFNSRGLSPAHQNFIKAQKGIFWLVLNYTWSMQHEKLRTIMKKIEANSVM